MFQAIIVYASDNCLRLNLKNFGLCLLLWSDSKAKSWRLKWVGGDEGLLLMPNAGFKEWSFQNICTSEQPNFACLIDTRGQRRMAKLVLRCQNRNSNSKLPPKKAVKPSHRLQKTICERTTCRILTQTFNSRTGRFTQNGQSVV